MRIQHVGLVVSDLERSRRFYREALALEEVPRPPNFRFDGAWFRFGEYELHLLAEAHTTGGAGQPDAGAGATQGLTHHLAFEVDDLEAACARLAEKGVALAGGPMPRGDGVTQVFFLDPDGYVLEYFERTGEDQSDAPPRAPVIRDS
jgi:catechol 2,3-dioxygenase-like lactoylglutathione lyase family enzyme